MSKGPGRNIRETLQNLAARLRSTHKGERDNARRMILSICAREGLDAYDYGVRVYVDPEEAKAQEAAWQAEVDELFHRIDRAAPFIDEGCASAKWPPSAKLKILYCVGATHSAEARVRAFQAVDVLLERARLYWLNGHHPDPFWNEENGLPPQRKGMAT